MDFEHAAQRLARDQKQYGSRRRRAGKVELSATASRQAQQQTQRRQRLLEQKRLEQARQEQMQSYMRQMERTLGVKPLGATASNTNNSESSSLLLRPTSIHGEGDKMALPPSVLERLTNSLLEEGTQQQQPWTFRIGILNPNYTFPSSKLWNALVKEDDTEHYDDDEDDNDDNPNPLQDAYLDELRHKYQAYTHGTVVEFTQEEGHVGLPMYMAQALLQTNNNHPTSGTTPNTKSIPTFRTKDPAAAAVSDPTTAMDTTDENNDEQTPGHLAWGAFDLPDTEIEITLLQHLPKGQSATLCPTERAIQQGFYDLKDIKYVLEQSLVRTRATLSLGDVVTTWHRGQEYALTVQTLTPYPVVSCINTDLEIDFSSPNNQEATTKPLDQQTTTTDASTISGGRTLQDTGRRLMDESSPATTTTTTLPTPAVTTQPSLLSRKEVPLEDPNAEHVVTIQIRAPNGKKTLQHLLHVQLHCVSDLFVLAQALLMDDDDDDDNNSSSPFQLVTRFPRRVWTRANGEQRLNESGIAAGQEQFLMEML